MIRRPLMAAALLSAGILSVALMRPALAAPGVKWGAKSVTPKTVPGNNAKVNVSVVATPTGGATVTGVSIRVIRGGSISASSSLQSVGKNKWGKTGVSLPANFTGATVLVDIWADAQLSSGTVKSTKVGTVKVTSATLDQTTPPPPPPI